MSTKFYNHITFKLISFAILVAIIFSVTWNPPKNVSAQNAYDEYLTETTTSEPTTEVTPTLIVENTAQPELTPTFTITLTPQEETTVATATVTASSTPTATPTELPTSTPIYLPFGEGIENPLASTNILEVTETESQVQPSGGMSILSVYEKKLSIPYIDQVYIQSLKDKATSNLWYLCGPSSVTMATSYFGVTSSSDVAVWNTAQQIFASKQLSSKYTDWSLIPSYFASLGISETQYSGAPKFSEIIANIDAGKPILISVDGTKLAGYTDGVTRGHIMLIVGYRTPSTIIVHDPYANRKWKTTNAPPTSSSKSNGTYVEYSISELNNMIRHGWGKFNNNPAPKITSSSPSSVQTSTSNITITIIGSNFIKGAVAKWNGANLSTTFVSSTQLKATIPTNLIKSGATANISIFNHLPGGGSSNNIIFTVNNPKPTTINISHRVIAQTGPDLTITVTGLGFVPTSVVKLNSTALATTYVSPTQLKAVIKSSLRAGVGKGSVSVYNPAPSGGTSNTQTLVKADFYSQISIISYHSKKALDLPGGRPDNSIKIQQWAWDRLNNNQKWLLIPTGNLDEFWIVSPSTTKCLDIANSSKENRGNLIQNTCNFENSQRFKRIKQGYGWLGTLSEKNYGYQNYYSFASVNSGKYLDVDNWSTQNGALVLQYVPGNKQGNQMWYVLTP